MFAIMICLLACEGDKKTLKSPPTVDSQLGIEQGLLEPPSPEEGGSTVDFEPDGRSVPVSDQGRLVIPTLKIHSSSYGIVFRFSEGCYVDVEGSNDTQELECTSFMNDPTWLNCLEREISLLKDGSCRCHMPGEAPEGGVPIDCPKPVE